MKYVKDYHILGLLYILPLLINGFVYIDDINRIHLGFGWSVDGRFAATWIMQFLSGGLFITDIYPYSLLISAILLIFSASIVNNFLEIPPSIRLFTCLLFLVSPYAIESLSYRFDSIPMSVAVLMSVLPFIYYRNENLFLLVSIVSLNLCLLTYQSNFFIYPVILLCYFIGKIVDRKKLSYSDVRLSICSVVAFLVSYVLYKVEVGIANANLKGRDATIFTGDFIHLLMVNIEKTYTFMVRPLFTPEFIFYISPMILLCLVSVVRVMVDIRKPKKVMISITLLAALIVLIVAIAAVPNLLLQNPWFSIRTGVPFGCFLFIAAVMTKNESKKALYFCYTIFFIYIFSMMSAYVAAYKAQEEMRGNIVSYFSGELAKHTNAKLVINGTMPNSEIYKSVTNKFPFLKRAIPNYMDNNWNWGVGYFRMHDIVSSGSYPSAALRTHMISNICTFSYEIKNNYAILRYYNEESVFVLDFKMTDC